MRTKSKQKSALRRVPEVRRGQYIGKRVGGEPKDESEHFMRCPVCGGLIDMGGLGQVFEQEGPLPHPKQDQPQSLAKAKKIKPREHLFRWRVSLITKTPARLVCTNYSRNGKTINFSESESTQFGGYLTPGYNR